MKENAIIYGVGKCYSDYKFHLNAKYQIDYLCDIKFDVTNEEYDGKKTLAKRDLNPNKISNIIICLYDPNMAETVKHELKGLGFAPILYDEVVPPLWGPMMTREELNQKTHNGIYIDDFDNKIEFEGDIPHNIFIRFIGVGNYIFIGKDILVGHQLLIECGTNSEVVLEEQSSFFDVHIDASWESIHIGKDCMFSFGVYVRNTDSHQIFSKKTGKRINYSKKIDIGNHVWIGQNAILLGGFSIGDGSIVGAGAVTASTFQSNIIAVGNPAKIIRKDIVWNRNATYFYDDDFIN